MQRKIAVVWKSGRPKGAVEVPHGRLVRLSVAAGRGRASGAEFRFSSAGPARLEIVVDDVRIAPGPEATRVTVRAAKNPFSFFLRDVSSRHPILISAYGVAVTEAKDPRGYAEIARDVRARGLMTELQRIESEPEESFETASSAVRNMRVPTWMGLTRDIRIFELGFAEGTDNWHWVRPRFHGYPVTLRVNDGNPVRYNFMVGRGIGCVEKLSRRIDAGVSPIVHATAVDGDVEYRLTSFVTLESKPLTARNVRGTDWRVADRFCACITISDEEVKRIDDNLDTLLPRDEETVFYARVEAVNTSAVPRYAWFKNPHPGTDGMFLCRTGKTVFDGETGFASFEPDGVYCVTRVDGKRLPQEEIAVLVAPGKRATFEFRIPHRPIPTARAEKLAREDFDARLAECRSYWKRKLASATKVRLPEKRIEEMFRAGIHHLDLVTYGRAAEGPLLAVVGVYSPIGSESAPIIQFTDSIGRHDVARRALEYFLDKQHPDGQMMNYFNYRVETGGVLWTLGEHYRYTRDDAWVKRIAPKLLKACDYILAWRRRNQTPELEGRGWGLVDGKVADPEDPYHAFMLNAYMVVGLFRVAEMLEKTDPAQSKRLRREAEAYRKDVRRAFDQTMARSPVVPLGDGSWCPTVAPWAEGCGPTCLFAEKGLWYTHAAFTTRDSLVGPLYLILQEGVGAKEKAADFLVNYHAELMHVRNAALTQPYYSPHALLHLRRGEVKAFLKTWYNEFASLADRQTYSFWEHYMHVSPHKTHEEGWFLMRTRYMLWMEDGDTLKLLAGVPRAWLDDGKRIDIERASSYFGPLELHVRSNVSRGRVEATVSVDSSRPPRRVDIRLPHPQGLKAVRCSGGTYDADTETVSLSPFPGRGRVTLKF